MNFMTFTGYTPNVYAMHNPFMQIPKNGDEPLDLSSKGVPSAMNYLYAQHNAPRDSSVCMSPKSISDSSDCDMPERMKDVSSTSNHDVKIPRPFKAYTKDPVALTLGTSLMQPIIEVSTNEAYEQFKEKMLARVKSDSGTNKNMRRNNQSQNPQNEDPSYREKRRKNNEAAKRSRDARKAKEDEIAIRCAFLEQENIKLKMRISAVEQENLRLQQLLSNLKVN